jgi:hypothetical protein
MTRQTGWVVGAVALALSIYGVSQLSAQRSGQPGGEVGRFVVVRSSADVTVIMDTTTGDLYNAVPSDIKPYAARGQGGRFGPMTPTTAKAATPTTRRVMTPLTRPAFKEAVPEKGDFDKRSGTKDKDKQ